MSINTTEEEAVLPLQPTRVPVLRVLHLGAPTAEPLPPARPLRTRTTVIGREIGDAGVALPGDSRVSRAHATLHLSPDGVRVIDEGSRNGTYLNGERVSEGQVRDGDVVRVGGSFLLLRYEPPAQEAAESRIIVGDSPSMRGLRAAVRRLGPSDASVLLLGESGTGKEVAARALHQESGRPGAFVAVNCSAIPESLAESQLFGHMAGSFTGAAPHQGLFRAAHGGTLFLDEVGEMAATMQPKLLRALEDHEVVPVGAVAPVRCDVRVIAATNRDLARAAAEGRFRGDVYARLAGVLLRLAPLRERREDVLPLLRLAMGGSLPKMTTELVQALLLHRWPYNVRELFKVADELRIRGAGLPVLGLDLLAERLGAAPVEGRRATGEARTLAAATPAHRPSGRRSAPGREQLEDLLRANDGNISSMAREMGRSRRQVSRWLEQHDLDIDPFRPSRPSRSGS